MSEEKSSKKSPKPASKDRSAGKWKKRKLPFNPVEGIVLLMFVGIFTLSTYRFLYQWDDLDGTGRNTFATDEKERDPASTLRPVITVDCEKDQNKNTSHNIIRLDGKLCGFESQNTSPLKASEILNSENKPLATLFTDENAGTFLTDDIALKSGENPIKIQFKYQDGRVVTRTININKVL